MIVVDVHIELYDDIEQNQLDMAIAKLSSPMIGKKVREYSFSWMRSDKNGK